MDDELQRMWRKEVWPISGNHPTIHLEGLRKTTKTCQDGQSHSWDKNQAPPKHKLLALTLVPTCLVQVMLQRLYHVSHIMSCRYSKIFLIQAKSVMLGQRQTTLILMLPYAYPTAGQIQAKTSCGTNDRLQSLFMVGHIQVNIWCRARDRLQSVYIMECTPVCLLQHKIMSHTPKLTGLSINIQMSVHQICSPTS
jgi:hypothetical protein